MTTSDRSQGCALERARCALRSLPARAGGDRSSSRRLAKADAPLLSRSLRRPRPLSGLVPVSLLVLLTGCGVGGSPSAPTPAATPPPGGAGFAYDGITHVSWWHDEYGYPAGTDSRRALAGTGAGWAGLHVTWYMDT